MSTTLQEKPGASSGSPANQDTWIYGSMYVCMAIVAALILYLTVANFQPILDRSQATNAGEEKTKIADYQVAAYHALPAQHVGRYKPFETACLEAMRQITGKNRWQKKDSVAVVLSWMLDRDPEDRKSPPSPWENTEFILCDHQEVRKLMFTLQNDGSTTDPNQLSHDQVHGKYMSPKQLRQFKAQMEELETKKEDRYNELIRPVSRQVEEVLFGRLGLYDNIRLGVLGEGDKRFPRDPFAFVALDQVKNSPWFSMGELRFIFEVAKLGEAEENGKKVKKWVSERWTGLMRERVKNAPQLYLSKEHQDALNEFQRLVKNGSGKKTVEELVPILEERREQFLKRFRAERAKGKEGREEAALMIQDMQSTLPITKRDGQLDIPPQLLERVQDLFRLMKAEKDGKTDNTEGMIRELTAILLFRDNLQMEALRKRLPAKAGYDPADPTFRMLHLTYLELRFDNLYKRAATWQEYPQEDVERVLISYRQLGQAYRTGDADKFDEATKNFLTTVREISEKVGPYPGEDTIQSRLGALLSGHSISPPSQELLNLEMQFNRVSPFTWAWVLMLGSLLFLCLSLGLNSRICYWIGMAIFSVSMLFQLYGFFVRIIVSGRPPVSNMYETVIWVSFMSAIFALILELIYKKQVIAIAGALVATIALVLADQLPLALDPRINPLVPVLRSNFWLTIHVLTIVSSYAGGTLAWGLANISLFLMVFGRDNAKATIKTLSQFTYRAIQIAVLLLAAGTFLGGWWAAHSWGRFWGWDPKETGALIALLCYVIPLHMRYIGWIKDFGLAVAAIICYAAILMSWYGVNFVLGAGLHSYGFGGGGDGWVYWSALLNIEWVMVATLIYWRKQSPSLPGSASASVPVSLTSPSASEHVKV